MKEDVRESPFHHFAFSSSIFTKWTVDELRDIGIYPYREDSIDQRYYYSGAVTYAIKHKIDYKIINNFRYPVKKNRYREYEIVLNNYKPDSLNSFYLLILALQK